MAKITLKVEIDDLNNAQLDGFEEKFHVWLREAYRKADAPDGIVEDVTEDDRDEDEEETESDS